MDAQRFDNLAKTLASRLSRRNALRRAGVAASASLLAATGMRPDQAAALTQAQNDGQPLFTLIRRYTLNVPTGQVRRALQQGYVEDACNAPGFVAYLTVEDEDGDFVTVAVFRSQNDMVNFANAEANWIAQNLDDLLPAPDEAISGDTYVHAAAPAGISQHLRGHSSTDGRSRTDWRSRAANECSGAADRRAVRADADSRPCLHRVRAAPVRPVRRPPVTTAWSAAPPPISWAGRASARRKPSATRTSAALMAAPAPVPAARRKPARAAAPTTAMRMESATTYRLLAPAPVAPARPAHRTPATPG